MKILVADGDPAALLYCESLLKAWGYEVVTASNGADALAILLAGEGPMLAIVDWMMPGMDGIALCRAIRQSMKIRYIYFIIVAAHRETEFVVAAMNAGADDFIGKPFDADELRVRVRAGLRVCNLEKELRLRGTHDALTGIYNRGAIMDILQKELVRHERERRAIAIIFADLDHFKKINEEFGQIAGDLVLREVTHRVASLVRPYDRVGRYDGAQLLIVLPTCESSRAIEVAGRISDAIADRPVTNDGNQIAVTMSIGMACINDLEYPTLGELIQSGEKALYRAKQEGRNRVEVAS
jgi:two-component system cell cycle response regulator